MKKSLFPIAAIALSLAACNSAPKFTINGTVEGETTGNALLIKQANSKLDTLAKAPIAEGKFVLTGTVAGLTDAYLVFEGKRGGIPVFVDNTVITATLNFNNPAENKIEGTEAQKLYNEYVAIQNEARKGQKDLYKAYNEAAQANDQAKMEEVSKQFDQIDKDASEKQDALTKANADTYVAAYMLATQMSRLEFEDLSAKYELLGTNAKASEPGKKVAERMKKLSAVAIGQKAPNFTLNTPEGKPLSLYDVKGKVKVIDFWASWCGPCRGENPNVVAMYKELHPKGLEILSVSLDNDKDAWLKAIEDDQLTWNHVSDLKGWQCEAAQLYAVNGIPHLVVLDENNVIVAKNLRGEELKNKVAELLK